MSSQKPTRPERSKAVRMWAIGLVTLGVLAMLSIAAYYALTNHIKETLAEASRRQHEISAVADQVVEYYEAGCDFPPSLPATVELSECIEDSLCSPDPGSMRPWESEGIDVLKESWFSISATRVDPKTYKVVGRHDFEPGGRAHTLQMAVRGTRRDNDCTAEVDPPVIFNEFE